jgi:hypothetical protein
MASVGKCVGQWTKTRDGRSRREVKLGLAAGQGVIYPVVRHVEGLVKRARRQVNRGLLTVIHWHVGWRQADEGDFRVFIDADIDGPAGVMRCHPLATYDVSRTGASADLFGRDEVRLIAWIAAAAYNMRVELEL